MAGRAPLTSSPGGAVPAPARFAVIAARFNEAISKKLVDGAVGAFAERGVATSAVEVHWVPGSFELPIAALALARTRRYAALVCVGVVIRGATPHFEHVTREAAAGIRQVGLTTGVPVAFGLITALDEGQAWERAGGAVGNRGEEAALAAHEMVGFLARAKANRRSPRRRGRRG
ncbi:MAG TPA: 6,7-dimethyl-8-ribityllumazine synthase [Candidatus Limnocylindrales bacterium]|nr:6,7-dimethyl-8-ribityllumazine synthase [Candidatus Limnocylindrales bacterium]